MEKGDPLRSTSVCLLHRGSESSRRPPRDLSSTFPISGRRSTAQEMSEFESDLWSKFWGNTTDPEMAANFGMLGPTARPRAIAEQEAELAEFVARAD